MSIRHSFLYPVLLIVGLAVALASCKPAVVVAGQDSAVEQGETLPDSLTFEELPQYTNPVLDKSLPDPTIIKADDGFFYLFATEDTYNVPIMRSSDLVDWEFVGTAFTNETRPNFVQDGGIWAPDINKIDDVYVLYYAMSTWGGEWDCGIGRAVSDKPEGPYRDMGKLFISRDMDTQNAIDPFYIEDNGRKYLFWGSFSGIWYAELSDDGLYLQEGTEAQLVAGNAYEAAYIHKHDGMYYLFASVGTCCEGNSSTYHVVVGRSDSLFGPYYDRNGNSMYDNNHEVVVHRSADFVGTGHNAEIVTDDYGQDWMLYHAFLAHDPERGRVLMLDPIYWRDGWPEVDGQQPAFSADRPRF